MSVRARKRRSNRLSPEQVEEARHGHLCRMHQMTMILGFGQEHLEWFASLYRSISLLVAQRMVRDHEAEQITVATENGPLVIFRETKPVKDARYSLPTMPNAASAEALASYTPGCRMAGRDRRRAEHVLAFPFIGDTKAPRVAPRVGMADAFRAQQLFQQAA